MPIRSIAEEAAARAKQVHLQSLRDKVYGKGGDKDGKEGGEKVKENEKPAGGDETAAVAVDGASADAGTDAEAPPAPPAHAPGTVAETTTKPAALSNDSLSSAPGMAGLQSPTSGSWRAGDAGAGGSLDGAALQSPTSTGWASGGKALAKEEVVTSHAGATVRSASAEEIARLEREQAIQEEEEPDEEEEKQVKAEERG
jgi:hypothetical protein